MQVLKQSLAADDGAARSPAPGTLEEAQPHGRRGKRESGERLEDATKTELYERAQDLDIEGRSTMTKKELVAVILVLSQELGRGARSSVVAGFEVDELDVEARWPSSQSQLAGQPSDDHLEAHFLGRVLVPGFHERAGEVGDAVLWERRAQFLAACRPVPGRPGAVRVRHRAVASRTTTTSPISFELGRARRAVARACRGRGSCVPGSGSTTSSSVPGASSTWRSTRRGPAGPRRTGRRKRAGHGIERHVVAGRRGFVGRRPPIASWVLLHGVPPTRRVSRDGLMHARGVRHRFERARRARPASANTCVLTIGRRLGVPRYACHATVVGRTGGRHGGRHMIVDRRCPRSGNTGARRVRSGCCRPARGCAWTPARWVPAFAMGARGARPHRRGRLRRLPRGSLLHGAELARRLLAGHRRAALVRRLGREPGSGTARPRAPAGPCHVPDLDLTAAIPWGGKSTYLRTLLLAIHHTAYYVGQIVAARRANRGVGGRATGGSSPSSMGPHVSEHGPLAQSM